MYIKYTLEILVLYITTLIILFINSIDQSVILITQKSHVRILYRLLILNQLRIHNPMGNPYELYEMTMLELSKICWMYKKKAGCTEENP